MSMTSLPTYAPVFTDGTRTTRAVAENAIVAAAQTLALMLQFHVTAADNDPLTYGLRWPRCVIV